MYSYAECRLMQRRAQLFDMNYAQLNHQSEQSLRARRRHCIEGLAKEDLDCVIVDHSHELVDSTAANESEHCRHCVHSVAGRQVVVLIDVDLIAVRRTSRQIKK